MKYVYYIFNGILVVGIVALLIIHSSSSSFSNSSSWRVLSTSHIFSSQVEMRVEDSLISDVSTDNLEQQVNTPIEMVPQGEPLMGPVLESTVEPISQGEIQVGNMSAYGPDCRGCSGHLGGGFDASSGEYLYQDATYGSIRIVAGDKTYPYGTIVKVQDNGMEPYYAIVLDRGGGIGFNKRYLFDLLFPSEAAALEFGSHKNVTFEIVRYGY